MLWLMVLMCGIDKTVNLNTQLESGYNVVRMADYPKGPNTDGCEDSVEVVNGVMTWTRFALDTGFFVLNPNLPMEERIHLKPHPDFPFTTTMARASMVNSEFADVELLPFNSEAFNGCQHLNGNSLYFHSENNGVKTLYKGTTTNLKLETMPFYGDNPHLIDNNNILIDEGGDLWVAKKGWFFWRKVNASEYFKAPINTQAEDVQPSWHNKILYYCRDYKEIWMFDTRTKTNTLLVKVKPNSKVVGGIGEPTFYNNRLYFLVCYTDGVNWDYDIVEGR